MPRFIVTPWRDISELIKARSQFYLTSSSRIDERRRAVELVRAWRIRGHLPHAVESTALLVDAILNDTPQVSPWCVRAAYSIAFARFVTGFVDSAQGQKNRGTMYKVAGDIGLPASFVELRHQIAHEELPSVTVLRQVTRRSLVWLWEYFWKHIDERIPTASDEKTAVIVSALKHQFREILRPYVKRRVRDAREGRGKTEQEFTSKEDVITDITCKACVRLCQGDAQTISVLVNVLLEPKFLIPANRSLHTSLTPAFNIWTPLLKSLSTHQQPFLSTLIDELLIQLTLPSNLDVTLDTYREAVCLWLIHILTDETWSSARKRSDPDMDSVVATCLMGQNVWSLRLVEKMLSCDEPGDEHGELRRNWGELVEIALAERNGERRAGGGGMGEEKEREEDMEVQQIQGDSDIADQTARLDGVDTGNDDGPGWRMWKGPWIPKPIGMI